MRVDLEGQRVERPGGPGQAFSCGQFEQPRRIAGPDGGAGRQHELGQLRLLADAGGRRQVPRIQPGAGQVDGRRRLRRQHPSRLTHGAASPGIRLWLRGLLQQRPHGVEWIELLRRSRKRGHHRGVHAGEAHQGRWTETGTREPTPRCGDDAWRSEIAASQPFDDPRPVREAAHPEHGHVLCHQGRQRRRHRGLAHQIADERRFPAVQRIGCTEEVVARARRKLRTESQRARRRLLARHRHIHVDERDLDTSPRGQSKGFEDRVARHEWHHRAHRGWSATLEGRHRRRPAARGPFERRPERRGQFQRHHGGPRRGKLLVDNPAENGVVVIRRHARQIAERLDERRFGASLALRQRHPPAPARPREPAAYPRRVASASARTARARACRACCRAGPS